MKKKKKKCIRFDFINLKFRKNNSQICLRDKNGIMKMDPLLGTRKVSNLF